MSLDASQLPVALKPIAPYVDLINAAAAEQGLPADVIAAIAMKESAGDRWASRFEPGWKDFWYTRTWAERMNISNATEQTLQAMSWGVMQVMGAVAREFGHAEELTMIILPELSIRFGCKKLKWLSKRYAAETDWIAAYNAGSVRKLPTGSYVNQRYVDDVCALLRQMRALK